VTDTPAEGPAADRLDGLPPASAEPVDSPAMRPPTPRWVGPVFFLLGVVMLPWSAYLAVALPEHAEAAHYDLAWVGFDLLLTVMLLRTAYLAWHGRHAVAFPATITATLLVVDSWFDLWTSPDRMAFLQALVMAVVVELPLAGICVWIARHAEGVRRDRIRFFRRRAQALEHRVGRISGP
jgi:hypothetical protein